MSWLRRGEEPEALDSATDAPPREAPYVPASQRPRAMPDIALGDGDGEGDRPDEQVEFLASLAQEVDREQQAPAEEAASTRFSRRSVELDDDLWAFHQNLTTTDPHEGLRKYTRDDIEMDELIDDLSVTMAALRRRRAA